MGIATAGFALASGNIAMKLSPAGQATGFLAASSVVSGSCAAIAPITGGLCRFFAACQLTLAFTWKGDAQEVTVQVLDFHSWSSCSSGVCRRAKFFTSAFIRGGNDGHRKPIAGV
jgi:hypothetical protein